MRKALAFNPVQILVLELALEVPNSAKFFVAVVEGGVAHHFVSCVLGVAGSFH